MTISKTNMAMRSALAAGIGKKRMFMRPGSTIRLCTVRMSARVFG